MVAEAAFQIGLFLLIVAAGFGVGELLRPIGATLAHLVGSAVITVLTITLLSKWSDILERVWPRPTE